MSRTRTVLAAVTAATALAVPAALAAPGAGAAGGHHGGGHHGGGPKGHALPYENPRLPVRARVADLLSRMTPAEKIGQMTQAERAAVDTNTSKITADNLGSVLSGGGSVPTPNTPAAWADMVDRYQRAA